MSLKTAFSFLTTKQPLPPKRNNKIKPLFDGKTPSREERKEADEMEMEELGTLIQVQDSALLPYRAPLAAAQLQVSFILLQI